MLKKYGIVGYKSTWYRFDFPLSNFLKLKHYISFKKNCPTRETVEGGYKEITTSDLEQEIKMLTLLLNE
ncbi:hypothetical protein [Aneurinibacillus uraniidurans]|uniref:hypothetical protein n=1 Tax=Aneurinibacillus uraniidurans TaxID=2966586 RepID=UPI00234B99EE|nr:hypothetical protein [Aneurinibacillus sp. B1]WCN37012.1 hypothetical protein PO771_14275 [Aneurinibacillus sp. B1]